MQSIRSRIFLFFVKHRHWFRLRLKRKGVDWNTSVTSLRQSAEKTAEVFGNIPKGIRVQPALMEDPSGEWVIPSRDGDDRVILYFHGGGYVMGSSKSHRHAVARVVRASGLKALIFDYRLAPEHPFPAALEDAVKVYRRELLPGTAPGKIAFMGDSAGGGLCLSTLLCLKDRNLPLPATAVAVSPWTDLTCSGASYQRDDPVAPQGSWTVFSKYYAGDSDPGHPFISPLYGNLEGLPPIFISVGENENLLDDSLGFAARAKEAGVAITLRVGSGMIHNYPMLAPRFPEARQAVREIGRFIQSHTVRHH